MVTPFWNAILRDLGLLIIHGELYVCAKQRRGRFCHICILCYPILTPIPYVTQQHNIYVQILSTVLWISIWLIDAYTRGVVKPRSVDQGWPKNSTIFHRQSSYSSSFGIRSYYSWIIWSSRNKNRNHWILKFTRELNSTWSPRLNSDMADVINEMYIYI